MSILNVHMYVLFAKQFLSHPQYNFGGMLDSQQLVTLPLVIYRKGYLLVSEDEGARPIMKNK